MKRASDQAKNEERLPSITMLRTTRLWAIVTEALRQEIAAEYQAAIYGVDAELEELENTSKRMMTNLFRTNPQQAMAVRQQVEVEKRRRERLKERLTAFRKQAEELELGSEYLRGTVQTLAELKPGDNLSAVTCGVEVVLRDGVVERVRQVDPDEADVKAAEFEERMGAVGVEEAPAQGAPAQPERPRGVQLITPGGAQPAQRGGPRLAADAESPSEES